MGKTKVPEERFEMLRNEITDYEEIKGSILTGIEDYEKIEYQKKKILKYLNATEGIRGLSLADKKQVHLCRKHFENH